MRDHSTDDAPDACASDARDLLPALLHGRLAGAERARAEAHVAACADCASELALLGEARSAIVASAPAVNVAAIAAAVRAATVPAAPFAAAEPARIRHALDSGSPAAAGVVPPSVARAARWRGARAWRALAATVLLAVGSGAVVFGRQLVGASAGGETVAAAPAVVTGTTDTRVAVAPAPVVTTPAPVARATESAAGSPPRPVVLASAEPLGTGFADLSDDELQSVLDAVTGDEGALPSADPEEPLPEIQVRGGQ